VTIAKIRTNNENKIKNQETSEIRTLTLTVRAKISRIQEKISKSPFFKNLLNS
jgi:uncharacterized protein (DUF736 family)